MIKHVVFDIGNVLADFHPIPYFRQKMADVDVSAVCACVFDEIWTRMDRGDFLCAEAMQIHLRKYPQYAKEISYIYEHWLEMMIPLEDTFAYMKECKERGFGVYLLSNIGVECHEYLAKRDAYFNLADGMVLSYQEHLVKPQREIFACLLGRYGLKGEECVFFDDSEANVATACAMGMRGIVFKDLKQAKCEAALW